MNRIIHKTLALTMALIFSSTALAQESIEQLNGLYNDGSLIRRIDDGEWLVYSHAESCNFSKVIDGITSFETIHLPDEILSVTDFEICNDYVYMCGYADDGYTYMGYFDLTAFPYPAFDYILLDGIDSVIKLDVVPSSPEFSNTLCQVVMTGEKSDGLGVIIDAVPSGTGWVVYHITPYHDEHTYPFYYDVAIVDDYVVFTYFDCTEKEYTPEKCTNGILYFSMPATPTTPLINSTLDAMSLAYIPTVPFLAKKCEGNAFVTATRHPKGNIYVSGFDGLVSHGTAVLHTEQSRLRDIAYNKGGYSTEVLVINQGANLYCSEIYTVLHPMATWPGSTWGHLYYGNILNSLIYQEQCGNRFIVTGTNGDPYQQLFLFRYNSTLFIRECNELFEMETTPYTPKPSRESFSMDYTSSDCYVVNAETTQNATTIEIICGEVPEN